MDFLSSVIVLWRFFVPDDLTDAVEKKLQMREERASMAISIIMGLLGFGLLIAAIDDFVQGENENEHQQLILGISFVSIITSGIMALYKFNYSVHLGSESLYKDGICSTIGAVLGLALFVNTLLVRADPTLWWIDPVVAVVCSIFALYLSAEALFRASVKEGRPIFKWSWWWHDDEKEAEGPAVEVTEKEEEKAKESEIV